MLERVLMVVFITVLAIEGAAVLEGFVNDAFEPINTALSE